MAKQTNPLKSNTFREEPVIEERPEEKPEEEQKKGRRNSQKKEKPAPPKKKPKEKKPKKPGDGRHYRVFGLFCLLFAGYLLLSFISYTQSWKADYDFSQKVFYDHSLNTFLHYNTPIDNWMGKFGALFSFIFLNSSFGVASFLFVLVLFTAGMKLFFRVTVFPIWRTIKYSFFGIIWIPVADR